MSVKAKIVVGIFLAGGCGQGFDSLQGVNFKAGLVCLQKRKTVPSARCELNYPMQFFAASMNVQRI